MKIREYEDKLAWFLLQMRGMSNKWIGTSVTDNVRFDPEKDTGFGRMSLQKGAVKLWRMSGRRVIMVDEFQEDPSPPAVLTTSEKNSEEVVKV